MAKPRRSPSLLFLVSGWFVASLWVLSSLWQRGSGQSSSGHFCKSNPFLNDFTNSELHKIEYDTQEFLASMYSNTMLKYDSLINCTDKGEPHPTVCPVIEPSGPHVQYSLLKPTMECRGRKFFGAASKMDGAKYVCSANRLTQGCTVYSLGSANDFNFEEDIIKETPCSVHTFDCTINKTTGPIKDRLDFYDMCIAGKSSSDGKYVHR
jgi:hypothetical protein